MKQSTELETLKRDLNTLEEQYKLYGEAQEKSKCARLKKDRGFALDDMFAYAKFIEQSLYKPSIFPIISNGNSFQFEDFKKYVDSDMPEYLRKIKARIEELEKEQ